MKVQPLGYWSRHALEAHCMRHLEENEADHFMVPQSLEVLNASFDPLAWSRLPAHAADWQRVWGLWDSTSIRGHVVLTGNALAPHRCTLGMGVERSFRGKGRGRELMTTAIDWVRAQPSLTWIDGAAFAGNAPVLNLDLSVGFTVVGRVPDVVRFESGSVDQLILTLKVRRNDP